MRVMRALGTLRWFGVGLALLAVVVAAPIVRAAPTAQVAATDNPAVFEFLATGFSANETISTWYTGPSQQVLAGSYYEADEAGEVGFQQLMRRDLQAGRWAITMYGFDSEEEAIVYFDVPARGPNLSLNVSQASGPVGTTFTFSATGFNADETVSYWLTGPAGNSFEGGVVQANSEGQADFSYVIGVGTQPGQWTMSAYGQTSDSLGVAQFSVTQ